MVFLSLKLIHSDSLEPFLTVCFAPLQTKDIEARDNFLQRAHFSPKINATKSKLYYVSHGVPQGSLLGPRPLSIDVNYFAGNVCNEELPPLC